MEEKIVENKKEDLPSLDLFHSLISIASLIYQSIYLVCLRSTTPLWFTGRLVDQMIKYPIHKVYVLAGYSLSIKADSKRITKKQRRKDNEKW